MARYLFLIVAFVSFIAPASGAAYPPPREDDFIIKDFHFASGETLPELRIHYRTMGLPQKNDRGVVDNAVLIMHGTTGSGGQFIRAEFAGELFGEDQLLDAERFFIILPDDIGHGKSSKPSDGLHAHFPAYRYGDMVAAEYRLITDGLKVDHLRLVMGTSMGGMHTWLWGENYPDFMDALMPLASLPTQISGRNRIWRDTISDVIRSDPNWAGGEYKTQPHGLAIASELSALMSSNPRLRFEEAPTRERADKLFAHIAQDAMKNADANDTLYAWESSTDYDPGPGLEKIIAPLIAVNSADDLINPPDQGVLEDQIKRVKHGRAVLLPETVETRGHGTHTVAKIWKSYLAELLEESK